MRHLKIKAWLWFCLLSFFFALPAFAKNFSGKAGPYDVVFSIRPFPVIVGNHHAKVKVKGEDGKPVTGAQVRVQTDMAGMPMEARPFPLTETKPGIYEGTVTLSMQGLWSLIVRVNSPQGEGKAEFQAETGKGGLHPWLVRLFIILLAGVVLWFLIRISGFLFSRKTWVPLLLFVGIGLLVYLAAHIFLKRHTLNTMGMKMDMNAADMGMSQRLLSSAVPVAVETVKRQPLSETVTYTGVVAPDLEETVYPRVIGWLSKFSLYPGDRIKRGQEIAKLDYGEIFGEEREIHPGMVSVSNAPHDVAVSELELEAAREKEKQTEDELRKAQANLTYWQKEFPREAFLLKQGAISKEEYDQEKAEYESALSDVHAHQRARSVASREKEIAAHALSITQDYRVLRAHISGVVTDRMVNQGVLVQPGTPILKIAKIDHVRIQVNVAEADLAQIQAGTPVVIRSPKLPGKTITARITSVFHQVNPDSRTGKVEAYIPNPAGKLFPGDFVDVDLALLHENAKLTVSNRAVVPYEGGYAVWIVHDGLAERKKVFTGVTNGEQIEIRSGLSEGDKVIVAGQEDLVPDQPVKEAAWGSGPLEGTLLPKKDEEEMP